MPARNSASCRHAPWLFGVGLLALTGCAEVSPEDAGPTPAQRALLGMTKQSLVACAGPPAVVRTRDDQVLYVYYREASQLDESFGGSKSSFAREHHGCRASITLQEDQVIGIRYQGEPSPHRDQDECEEIFRSCVAR
jgi:hypothetical protein